MTRSDLWEEIIDVELEEEARNTYLLPGRVTRLPKTAKSSAKKLSPLIASRLRSRERQPHRNVVQYAPITSFNYQHPQSASRLHITTSPRHLHYG